MEFRCVVVRRNQPAAFVYLKFGVYIKYGRDCVSKYFFVFLFLVFAVTFIKICNVKTSHLQLLFIIGAIKNVKAALSGARLIFMKCYYFCDMTRLGNALSILIQRCC